ncbi:hypothetical protein FISHEDRAFT_56592 [Fistulina hepatica ATCC 64428]|uniref:Uncharacterized protein n=1 Tax=Fistulina hepatica ATCC 64428 TaxID=1128425 RepID=A0A0D7AIX1_9AGAR|nr:hypothetical protein FISHEDRAFT_56592 [Fistulina hepatica ATCC 64428]
MDEIQLFFTASTVGVSACVSPCLMKANGVWYPYVYTAILSLISLGANGTWFGEDWILPSSRKDYFDQLLDLRTLLTVTNSMSAAIDVILSLVMIFLLQISKTGFRRSTDIINRLVSYYFTGIPTAIFALLSEITARTFFETFF